MFRYTQNLKFFRTAAICAILISSFGQLVHLHQCECGDSACGSRQVAMEKPCPFGCDSCRIATKTSEQDAPQEQGPHKHDKTQCPVCSVLAQLTDSPKVVELPVVSLPIVEFVRIFNDDVVEESAAAATSRGPPFEC